MDLDPLDGKWPADRDGFLTDLQAKRRFLQEGHATGASHAVPDLGPKGILFAGMGFSGVSSDLVRDAGAQALEVPLTIAKHYDLPGHVRPDWHVLAVSYSGGTEETLSVARAAKERGVPMTAFSTGGAVADLADRNVEQPPGHQPRAALGYAWFSVLGFLEGSGVLPATPVQEAVAAVKEVDAACGPDVPEERNEAKQLARRLVGPVPQIYSTPELQGVGHQFRGMLNENAKKIAGTAPIPDCNHNDLTGWGGDGPNRGHFTVLVLRHAAQNPQIDRRIAYMRERYTAWDVPWHEHTLPPMRTFEERVVGQAQAIQFLDYVSFYVAMLRDEDPSSIKEIKALKAYLKA